jgi:hypothetical protein
MFPCLFASLSRIRKSRENTPKRESEAQHATPFPLVLDHVISAGAGQEARASYSLHYTSSCCASLHHGPSAMAVRDVPKRGASLPRTERPACMYMYRLMRQVKINSEQFDLSFCREERSLVPSPSTCLPAMANPTTPTLRAG